MIKMVLRDFCEDVVSEFSKFTFLLDVFIGLHAFIKYIIRRPKLVDHSPKNITLNLIISLLCVALTILFLIVGITVTFPFMLYKLLITAILRIKYKKNYGGLLQGADSLWVTEDETSRNIVNFVFVLQFNKSKDNLLEYVKEICITKFFTSSRLTCVRQQFMGYVFFIKNQLSTDDVVKEMKFSNGGVCDTESLQKFVQEYSNKPLPKNDTAAWELIVGKEPLKLKGLENEGEQYPLLIRIHHTVADGITLFSLIIKVISDEGTSILEHPKEVSVKSLSHSFISWALNFHKKFKRIFTEYVNTFMMAEPPDENILQVPRLSGEKKIGFYLESKPHYVHKVKRIKNILGGTFSDVLFTAISASLNDYFKKNTTDIPNYITLTFLTVPNKDDLRFTHDKLRNIFSMGSIKLPINLDKNSYMDTNMIDRYFKIKEEYKKCNDSYDIWMYYWQLKIFSNILPIPVLKRMVKLSTMSTVSFSNIPGFKRIHISRQALNHILFWIPNFINVGVGFSVITYDDRFQMGLLADKLLISDEKKVQEILDNVFKYVDLLNKEVERRQNGH